VEKESSASKLPFITFLLLLACVGAIYVLHSKMQVLSEENIQIKRDVGHLLGEVSSLLEALEHLQGKRQSPSLDHTDGVMPDYEAEKAARMEALRQLTDGVYQLETRTALSESSFEAPVERDYTIYHIRMTIASNGNTYPIQVAVATSGYVSIPRMYIDYDSDGKVDVEALHQLVSWLPLQKIFTRTVNPITSQQLYNAFLLDAQSAHFSSATKLAESGNQLAREIWNTVASHTDDILGWIETDNSDQEAVGSSAAPLHEGARF
jgi:hypothetical protein